MALMGLMDGQLGRRSDRMLTLFCQPVVIDVGHDYYQREASVENPGRIELPLGLIIGPSPNLGESCA
jgi:hypothetical protein